MNLDASALRVCAIEEVGEGSIVGNDKKRYTDPGETNHPSSHFVDSARSTAPQKLVQKSLSEIIPNP